MTTPTTAERARAWLLDLRRNGTGAVWYRLDATDVTALLDAVRAEALGEAATLCEAEGRARLGAMDSVANLMADTAKRIRVLATPERDGQRVPEPEYKRVAARCTCGVYPFESHREHCAFEVERRSALQRVPEPVPTPGDAFAARLAKEVRGMVPTPLTDQQRSPQPVPTKDWSLHQKQDCPVTGCPFCPQPVPTPERVADGVPCPTCGWWTADDDDLVPSPDHRELTALRAVAAAARVMWETNDDGHRCASDNACTSCEVRDALAALPSGKEGE